MGVIENDLIAKGKNRNRFKKKNTHKHKTTSIFYLIGIKAIGRFSHVKLETCMNEKKYWITVAIDTDIYKT